MRGHLEFLTALALGLVFAFAQEAVAQQNAVTAIDSALEPDATMGSARDGGQRSTAQWGRPAAAGSLTT